MWKFEPIQPGCGLKIVGNATIQVFCGEEKNALRKKLELIEIEVNRWVDSFSCFTMNQTMNKNKSGSIDIDN